MIIISKLEKTYSYFLNRIFSLVNPIKRSIKKTECKVHIFLNEQALNSLLSNKHLKEYTHFKPYISSINEGVVWADQDFKSSSHFYNPYKKRGLYGSKNAMDLAIEYYNKAIKHWKSGNKNRSMFFLGAAIHLVQDMTVPQHANIRLLDDHHQYESFVKKIYNNLDGFNSVTTPYKLDSIKDYIRFNTRVSLKIYRRYKHIQEDDCRYLKTIKCTLPLARRTSAGVFILFYKETTSNFKA